ncbi:hypothetical protein HK100_000011 [Physocladia obscura]|uniref:Orc1-like AAA ATPase domain-containing protein n=1 Tax=Physocladia obscura TaxID=109957 RepID=A0AAD5TAI3_9FUNG|nr:hypothetical protein HK100_000011 [Physocladia obscura]
MQSAEAWELKNINQLTDEKIATSVSILVSPIPVLKRSQTTRSPEKSGSFRMLPAETDLLSPSNDFKNQNTMRQGKSVLISLDSGQSKPSTLRKTVSQRKKSPINDLKSNLKIEINFASGDIKSIQSIEADANISSSGERRVSTGIKATGLQLKDAFDPELQDLTVSNILTKLFTGPECDILNAIPGLNLKHNATTVTVEVLPRLAVLIAQLIYALSELGFKVAILIDDLQWCDSYSLELSVALMQKCPKMLFVGLQRPLEEWKENRMAILQKITTSHATNHIHLQNLERAGVESMISKLSCLKPGKVSPSLTDEIFHKSQGNPLVAEVLIKLLNDDCSIKIENGTLIRDGNENTANLPSGATAAVVAQFDKLKPEMKAILKYASISGMFFNLNELNDILIKSDETIKYDSTVAGLEDIIALYDVYQFVKETETKDVYCFSHYLIQQGILSTMVPSKREEIHSVYADYFLKRMKRTTNKWENIQSVVHHLFQVSGQEERKQLTLYTAFLESAEIGMVNEAFEFYEALQDFEKKLTITKNVYEAIQEQRLLAHIHFCKGNTMEAQKHCTAAFELAGYKRSINGMILLFRLQKICKVVQQILLLNDEYKKISVATTFNNSMFPKALKKSNIKNFGTINRHSMPRQSESSPHSRGSTTSTNTLSAKIIQELVQVFQISQKLLAPSYEQIEIQGMSLILGFNSIGDQMVTVASYLADFSFGLNLIGVKKLSLLADQKCVSILEEAKKTKYNEKLLSNVFRAKGLHFWRYGKWQEAAEYTRTFEKNLNKEGLGFSEPCYSARIFSGVLFGDAERLEANIDEDSKFHSTDDNSHVNAEFLFRKASLYAEFTHYEEAESYYKEAIEIYSVSEEDSLRTLACMLNALRAVITLIQCKTDRLDRQKILTKRILTHFNTCIEILNTISPLYISLTPGICLYYLLFAIELFVFTKNSEISGEEMRQELLTDIVRLLKLIAKCHTPTLAKPLTEISSFVKQLSVATCNLWAGNWEKFSKDAAILIKGVSAKQWFTKHLQYLLKARIWCVQSVSNVVFDELCLDEVVGFGDTLEYSGFLWEAEMIKHELKKHANC